MRRHFARFGSDPMVTNSFFVMASTALMAVLGLAFWTLCARLFAPSEVGEATSLLSATSLISYVALFGFNSTFMRMLPQSTARNTETNTGLLAVALGGLALSALYVVGLPVSAPKLDFILRSPWEAVGFIVLTAASAVNLITDSVFIAHRAARYNLLVDGVAQSGTRVGLPLLLTGLGAFGIFLSFGLAALLAVGLSLFFMIRRFDYRPSMRLSREVLRRVRHYSAANYAANVLNIVPTLVLPLLVLDRLSAAAAAYYFVAFQVANLLYAVGYAVSQTLLAEGGHAETPFRVLVRRSAALQLVLLVPAALLLFGVGHYLLAVFGAGYQQHSSGLLEIFALSAPVVALNTWTSCLLRITGQLRALIWSNVVFAVLVCGLGAWWVGHGLAAVGLAWLIGNLASGLVGGVALLRRPATSPTVPTAGGEHETRPVLGVAKVGAS